MAIHLTAFALFLAACVLFMIVGAFKQLISPITYDDFIVNVTIAVIVLQSVAGLILMRIFKKIYIVVKNRAESNEALEDLYDRDGSFVLQPTINGSRVPEI